jgi:acyl CoA:acetate/3-ketoacid CoA transferase beta subunit
MLTDTITTHGVFVGGRNSRCLSVLGAGQIDSHGNINSSRTSGGDFLVGTGGANDAANANEVIIILHQSRKRFVETLPYITAVGKKVSRVVSTMGIFKKAMGKSELYLDECLPDRKVESLEQKIKRIEDECSWDLKHSGSVSYMQEPTRDELSRLRSILLS